MIVPIRFTVTNEVRIYHWGGKLDDQYATFDHQEFWWEEGNGACDCNRRMFFIRAKLGDQCSDSDERVAMRELAKLEGTAFDEHEQDVEDCTDRFYDIEYLEIDGVRHPLVESRR